MRLIKKLSLVVLAVFALYLLILWTEWLPLSSLEGKKAVELMDVPLKPVAAEQNAFSEAWLFPYEIPESDIAGVMAADIEKFKHPDMHLDITKLMTAVDDDELEGSTAKGIFPEFEDGENMLCNGNENCLAKIRGNLGKYKSFFSEHERFSRKAVALTRFSTLNSMFAIGYGKPAANMFPVAQWQRTTAAYWFATGKRQEAIALTCDAAGAAHRMAENSDLLFDRVLSTVYYEQATRLLADLLSEIPNEIRMPETCHRAYEPVYFSEQQECRSAKLSYQLFPFTIEQVKAGKVSEKDLMSTPTASEKLTTLLLNPRATQEDYALQSYKYHCASDNELPRAYDSGLRGIGLAIVKHMFNPVGEGLADNEEADFREMSDRMENLEHIQMTMQVVLQLRSARVWPKDQEWVSVNFRGVQLNAKTRTADTFLLHTGQTTRLFSLPVTLVPHKESAGAIE